MEAYINWIKNAYKMKHRRYSRFSRYFRPCPKSYVMSRDFLRETGLDLMRSYLYAVTGSELAAIFFKTMSPITVRPFSWLDKMNRVIYIAHNE